MAENDFTNIKFTSEKLDIFYIRSSIFLAIKNNLTKFRGRLLDVGCGEMPYKKYLLKSSQMKEYVGLDIDSSLVYGDYVKPDAVWDGKKIPFGNNEFDTVLGTELLEHCPDPGITLGEIIRVLKPAGTFFFTVPFLWPLHESPHDEFRYTPYALERILRESGFKNIKIKAGGGWHASLAQMLGLWTRRAPLKKWQRKFFSVLAKPIVKRLLKKDKKTDLSINDQQMFTNFYGTAQK